MRPEFRAYAQQIIDNAKSLAEELLAGGLRLYHEALGAPVEELRMNMPINIRSSDDEGKKAGNQFVPARFSVPIGIEDSGFGHRCSLGLSSAAFRG